MKITISSDSLSGRKNTAALLLAMIFLLQVAIAHSQETAVKKSAVYPTFGVGFGFFHPGDVNDYIALDLPSGYITEYGTQEMFMFFDIHAGVTFRMKQFDVSALLEYDIAPKWIMISDGNNLNYMYSRIAPGVTANYYVPVGTGRHAFFIGGGINYSFMKFEEFSASSPGFRLQAGFSLQFGTFNLQPFGAFNYASATDTDNQDWEDFNLNYTNGQIGVNFSFHPKINFK